MAAHQASLSLGFSRQEHWSGLPFLSPMHESEKWKWSRSVESNPQRPHELQPSRLLHPWDFPGKSTGEQAHRHREQIGGWLGGKRGIGGLKLTDANCYVWNGWAIRPYSIALRTTLNVLWWTIMENNFKKEKFFTNVFVTWFVIWFCYWLDSILFVKSIVVNLFS